MVFLHGYGGAMMVLKSIETGACKDQCKRNWLQNIRRAIKSKTNPLKLDKTQKNNLTKRIKEVSKKNAVKEHSKTIKKYKDRKSPPYPANDYCGKMMKGNDGNKYESRANKNGVCSWKKIN